MKHIISLGAGVQSSTMALMAAAGEITPMPDGAIFADTQSEPRAVYEWLDWLEPRLPFPVYRVTAGSLFNVIGSKRRFGRWPHMPIPAYTANDKGRASLLNRSCTQDFKIRPLTRKVRELAGLTRKRSPKTPVVTQWIGISTDEAHRAKPSREPWIEHRFPLLDAGVSRQGCLAWMKAQNFPTPPKSSCTFCPYHGAEQWRLTKADPEAWAQAVEIDERIRTVWHGRASDLFLHRSLKPLADVDFSPRQPAAPDYVQMELEGFGNECEGLCGN